MSLMKESKPTTWCIVLVEVAIILTKFHVILFNWTQILYYIEEVMRLTISYVDIRKDPMEYFLLISWCQIYLCKF
jgi:hypothetical protein